MKIKKVFKSFCAGSLVVIMCSSLVNSAFAWPSNQWHSVSDDGYGRGTGHASMIGKIAFDTNEHREITQMAARLTDELDCMDAGATTAGIYSPYHAKSEYSMDDVKKHLKFLYELARRRIVLGSQLDLDPSDYKSSSYYGAELDVATKRRIIKDLQEVVKKEKLDGHNMTNVKNQGYMVLGVYFHLLEDTYCHRAKFTSGLVGTIHSDHFTSNGKNELIKKIASRNGIPMIRLKDYLKDSFPMSYTVKSETKTVNASKAAAYEDNPFFYTTRYSAAYKATKDQLKNILNDKSSDSSKFVFNTYGVSLFGDKW